MTVDMNPFIWTYCSEMAGHGSYITDDTMSKATWYGHYIPEHNIDKGSDYDPYIT